MYHMQAVIKKSYRSFLFQRSTEQAACQFFTVLTVTGQLSVRNELTGKPSLL